MRPGKLCFSVSQVIASVVVVFWVLLDSLGETHHH